MAFPAVACSRSPVARRPNDLALRSADDGRGRTRARGASDTRRNRRPQRLGDGPVRSDRRTRASGNAAITSAPRSPSSSRSRAFAPIRPVPGLRRDRKERDRARRERAGVPKLVLDAALALPSSNGRSYGERLDAVKTEMQMSDLFEDFIDRVPLGRTFFAERNPVRTAGPMQVSVSFAESVVAARPYPYPMSGSVRKEVFTRRGGLYFGVAHLLDFAAPYDRYLYRFADFNAGRYASRNAAFQSAVTQVSGIPLTLDGDVLRYDNGQSGARARCDRNGGAGARATLDSTTSDPPRSRSRHVRRVRAIAAVRAGVCARGSRGGKARAARRAAGNRAA